MNIGYWNSRSHFGYYVLVKAWLEAISLREATEHASIPRTVHDSLSILDVGCLDTPTASWGFFDQRYTVDIAHDPQLPGVQSFVADFLTWQQPHHMSVVTCLQVMEHLPNGVVEEFGAKLRAISDVTIVSVPFMWAPGFEADHRQDPIDLAKFSRFMGGPPDEYAVIKDTKHHRIVGRWNNLP